MFSSWSACHGPSGHRDIWGGSYPRRLHNPFTDCQIHDYTGCNTVGEWAGSYVKGYTGVDKGLIAGMIDEYLAANPNGTVIIGNYTPRGRKRRGLHSKQRGPVFCVRLGGQPRFFPGVEHRFNDVTIHQGRATVRCICRRVNRAHIPLTTVLWAKAS